MPVPAPLVVPWRGHLVRVRHDDPRLTPHSPRAAVIISAAQLAVTVDGLRRVLHATVGQWYAIEVREEPLAVGLRRRLVAQAPASRSSVTPGTEVGSGAVLAGTGTEVPSVL